MNGKLLVLTFEFPPHPGGIGTFAYQIARNLHLQGLPIIVLTTPSKIQYQSDESFDQMQLFPVHRFNDWRFRWLAAVGRTLQLLMFCRQQNIKLIYCPSPRAAYSAYICKLLLGIPFVLVGIGSESTHPTKPWIFVVRHAGAVLAISQYTASLMKSFAGQEVTVIPLGADVEQFVLDTDVEAQVQNLREKYGLQKGLVLLSVGRLNPRKGHDITLRALLHIKPEYPEVRLVIIGASVPGADSYETSLHHFVNENDLTENVKCISVASSEELKAFYAMADIFILSSRDYQGDVEGFGIVLIEANLMGTPVVAANLGGIPDAVEDGKSGFLYACEDAQDLANKALVLLKDDALRSAMGAYGRSRALEEFNWRVVAEKTWGAITRMLPSARGM